MEKRKQRERERELPVVNKRGHGGFGRSDEEENMFLPRRGRQCVWDI